MAQLLSHSNINQVDTDEQITATVIEPMPAHYEVSSVDTIYHSLNDEGPTILSDTPTPEILIGPDDQVAALEWERTLQPYEVWVITKEKFLEMAPPPPPPLSRVHNRAEEFAFQMRLRSLQ
jgi:hypothetical protein